LLVFENNSWSYFDSSFNEIQSLDGNINKLIVTSKYWIKLYDSDLVNYYHLWKYQFTTDPQYPLPSSAVFDANEDLWIADKNSGLVYSPESWKFEKVSINGPQNYTVFDLASLGSEVYGVSGGMNLSLGPNFYHAMVYKFTNQVWETFYYKNMPELSPYRDLVRIVVDPNDPTHYFCGSWVSGLLEFKNNQFLKLHNSSNSTLETVVGIDYTRIGGLAFDADGNLWVTNSLTSPQIHVMTPAGVWSSIDYSASIGGINLGQIIVTKDDIKWVILPQGVGLFVFDDNNTPSNKSDDKYKKLSIINETGEIISNSVFSIAEDKDGYIWVGTSKGVAVYYNPEEVFESGTFTARQVKIPRNDGTDKADILLANEIVTSIKIDGANRKWFGTQTGGVYYTSEDGLEQIYHFTKDNSPLLDNNIICSTVVPNTGEVFFGTAQGMISYRSTATEGSDDYTGVYAFPNPVKPDYVGPITITGLVAGSYVKITDISGNMVFEMRSEGGQAIWYGNDLSGRRVQTGVYMVFSTNETGSKTDITKILFIN
jgi:sugar lactone lactonase YvrE